MNNNPSAFSLLASFAAFIACETASAQTNVRAPADFNADGFADLAIGVPNEGVTCLRYIHVPGAGVVHVVYGKATPRVSAPRAFANQLLSGPCKSGKLPAKSYAHFGTALAYGDFNNDGFDDLAVGIPNASDLAGSVAVYTGSALGLARTGTITKAMMPGASEVSCLNFNNNGESSPAADTLGVALAADDVDQDGYVDLAIASTCVSGISGAVHLVTGSSQGLNPASASTRNYFFSNTVPATLTFGDFDGNNYPDLAIGAPIDFAWWVTYSAQGHVLVQYGDATGLSATPQHLSSALVGLPQSQPVSNDDRFGHSLTSADFNADGYSDLAIGVPGKNSGAGQVHVLFGSASRLTTTGALTWSQASPMSNDFPESGDRAGTSLAVGNFNNDGFPDLAIGVPGEDQSQGVAHVLTFTGSTIAGHQRWRQGYDGIVNPGEFGDRFGTALTSTDLDGDGFSDIAIAAPGEDLGGGLINLVFGGTSGLSATGNWILKQGFDGLLDTSEQNDQFGVF